MSRRIGAIRRFGWPLLTAVLAIQASALGAQQKIDEEYTKLIKQYLRDPRITTELVDHLPASSTVPTPLKHFGHIMGTWGVIDKAEDMHKYLAAIARPRADEVHDDRQVEEGATWWC